MSASSFRFQAALALARLAAWLSRTLLHGSGNVIGGAVLERLALRDVTGKAHRHRITIVSGTNGKSTTTAMIAAALSTATPVTTNADGANTPHGLLWTVATARTDEVVLEVDEAWVPWAVGALQPHTAALLNLTRDQLHRKPEILPLAASWRRAMASVERVVAAADDPAVTWAAETGRQVEYVGAGTAWHHDAAVCPRCGDLLRHPADDWACRCGFVRPATPVAVDRSGRLLVGARAFEPHLTLPGEANLANLAIAVATTRDRVSPEVAVAQIAATVHEVAGRYRDVDLGDQHVRLLLAKNPAGWQAALGMLREGAATVLAMSADGIDGRDTSWLYDVDVERLRGRPLAVTGSRATDMVVRLHLDDIETAISVPTARDCLRALPPGDVDVVATYSSFQAVRRELHVA